MSCDPDLIRASLMVMKDCERCRNAWKCDGACRGFVERNDSDEEE